MVRAPPPRPPTLVARLPPPAATRQRTCVEKTKLVVRAPLPRPPILMARRPPLAATRQRACVEETVLVVRTPPPRPPTLMARRPPRAATRQRACVEETKLVERAPPPRPPALVARRPPLAATCRRACVSGRELVVRAPPPRPPPLSVRMRLREVAPQPQDRPLMRPPRRPQLSVWRLCRTLPWFWVARTLRRFLFCASCGRARPPRIEQSSSVSATTCRPISLLIAGPFWTRICSAQRFFFCHHGFFSSHIGTSAAATTPTRDRKDAWTASVLSRKTDEAAALYGVGGCPRVVYTFKLQHDWCTSKKILPCSLLGRSRRVGQSRVCRKKKKRRREKQNRV